MNNRLRVNRGLRIAATALLLMAIGCAGGRQAKSLERPNPSPAAPEQTRLTSMGRGAMVVSAHETATDIGEQVLREGGNAVDAALATLSALNVVEPQASGLGGGGYVLYYHAKSDSFYAIDFRERAPGKLEIEDYFQPDDSIRTVQRWDETSVLVPGCAAGWHELHSRFGSTPLKRLFAPAVALADTGFPATDYLSHKIEDKLKEISSDPALARVFLRDGAPASPGEIIRQPQLAGLYRLLGNTGLDRFYHAPVGSDLIHQLRRGGSSMTEKDLASYRVAYREPLVGDYRGYEIITVGPPSGGGVAMLETLELLEAYDLKSMGFGSLDYYHTLASAVRIARENQRKWSGDPDFHHIPIDSLLSPARIAEKRATIFPDSVDREVSAMSDDRAGGDSNTTHLVVVDHHRNLLCLTQSINYYFGSGVMVPEWGLILNNLMADFRHDTTGINSIQPFHRPGSKMACTIIKRFDRPLLVIGTPGGTRIASTMAQVLVAILDFEMTLPEALAAPRFYTAGRRLAMETRIPDEVQAGLAAKGWKVDPTEALDPYFGGVNAIQFIPETGEILGATDPRRDGKAAGF